MVVLSTVSIARDIPLHTEGPRGCLASDLVVDTLGSTLVDVQIAPEGEKRVGGETDVSSGERLVSVRSVTCVETEEAVDGYKNVSRRVAVDRDGE